MALVPAPYIPAYKQLYQGAPTTETTLYTAASTVRYVLVKQVIASNQTDAELTFSLSVVASGGTAGAANRIAGGIFVPAHLPVMYDIEQPLAPSSFLSGIVQTSGLVLTIAGIEV